MAQDQTNKRRAIALNLTQGKQKIYEGLRQMEEAAREYGGAGLTFVQADFDGTDLQHLTPAIAASGMASAAALRSWLQSSFNDTNFELL